MIDSKNQDTGAAPPGVDGGAPSAGPAPGRGAPGPVAHTGEGGTPTPVEPPGDIHIRVDRLDLVVPLDRLTDGKMTGRQIRELPEPPIGADRDLFEIVPGGSDTKVGDDQAVVIREWMRFFSAPRTINPGGLGGPPHFGATRRQTEAGRRTRDAAG